MARILTIAALTLAAAALSSLPLTSAVAGAGSDGAAVFRTQCGTCHSATARGGPVVGPRLFGVVGRRAGTLPGFTYSAAMKNSGLVWNQATLSHYLANPAQVVHGTKMPYAGLHNPAQLASLVSYLDTLH